MIYENPPIYVDPKYWEKRAYAAEYREGLALARVAELEGENAALKTRLEKAAVRRAELPLPAWDDGDAGEQ